MKPTSLIVSILASLALGACDQTSCPSGTFRSGGRCVPRDSADAGPRTDSGPGMDAGPGVDGGDDDAGAPTDAGALPDGSMDGAIDGAIDAGDDAGVSDAGPSGVLGICETCASDASCVDGMSCVDVDGSARCYWREEAPAGPNGSCVANGRPFTSRRELRSVDGADVVICALAVSSCAARLDYAVTSCADASGCGNGGDDVACVDADPGMAVELRCTMTCASDNDCPGGVSCDTSAVPIARCRLN